VTDPSVTLVEPDRSERCAALSALRADPMLGTAFPAARLLLVEQPGPWGRAGLLDSRFSRSVAHRLIARLDPTGVRVLAIRRPGRSIPGGRRRWALVDCRPGRERLRWGTYADDADLLSLDTAAAAQPPELREGDGAGAESPIFLVCAHGTHDACCALRGRPVAAALALARPSAVWESSHVGGDRFAANVLVLPTGILYGRVPESAASTLVAATDHGLVLEEYLRGRVGFAPHDQVAMAHVHRERPGLRVDDVLSLGSSIPEPGLTAVRVRAGAAIVEVTVRVEHAQREWLTCQALQPSSAVVHRPVSLRKVSGADAR
jgi:hypothetical protein